VTAPESGRTDEARDLRARIGRTLDYTDSLLRLPDLSPALVVVLRAVHNSLCTPVATPQSAEPTCNWPGNGPCPMHAPENAEALAHALLHNEHATRPNQHDEAVAAGEIDCPRQPDQETDHA
jgi:hypothetical protein